MDFVIACRTYKRYQTFIKKTYQMLKDNNLLDRLYIFVANEEERILYEEALANLEHRPCIIGEIGCEGATRATCNYFPEGQAIFFVDDDLARFYNFSSPGVWVKKATNLKAYIEDGFKTIDENNLGGFTVSGYSNKFYLKGKPFKQFLPYTLSGSCFGARNDKELIITKYGHLEDILRSCKYINKYGGCLVYWYAGFDTNYGKEPGGMQSFGRENTKELSIKVWGEDPLIQKYYKAPAPDKSGHWANKRKASPGIYKSLLQDNIPIRKLSWNDFIV